MLLQKPAESSSDKRDNGSISSSGDGDSTKTGKSSKLFASIGKRSMRSLNGTIKSTDEVSSSSPFHNAHIN